MIPYSRPKLSDLYTLSQSKLLGNHYTLHRGTYLYSPYMAVLPPPPHWGRIFASKGLCTSRGGYPCATVYPSKRVKDSPNLRANFHGKGYHPTQLYQHAWPNKTKINIFCNVQYLKENLQFSIENTLNSGKTGKYHHRIQKIPYVVQMFII